MNYSLKKKKLPEESLTYYKVYSSKDIPAREETDLDTTLAKPEAEANEETKPEATVILEEAEEKVEESGLTDLTGLAEEVKNTLDTEETK